MVNGVTPSLSVLVLLLKLRIAMEIVEIALQAQHQRPALPIAAGLSAGQAGRRRLLPPPPLAATGADRHPAGGFPDPRSS